MAIEDPKKQRLPISRETKANENYIYIYTLICGEREVGGKNNKMFTYCKGKEVGKEINKYAFGDLTSHLDSITLL
jgi:hypothetical protein